MRYFYNYATIICPFLVFIGEFQDWSTVLTQRLSLIRSESSKDIKSWTKTPWRTASGAIALPVSFTQATRVDRVKRISNYGDLKTWRLKPSELVLLYALLDCEDLPKWEIKRVRPHRTFHQTPTSCVLSDASRLPLEFWRLRAVRGRSIAKAIGSPVPSLGSCAHALVLWDPRKHCKDGINDNQPRSPNAPKNNISQLPMFYKQRHGKTSLSYTMGMEKTEAKGFTND